MTSTGSAPRFRTTMFAALALVVAVCSSSGSTSQTSEASAMGVVALAISVGTQDGPTIATASLSVDADGHAAGTGFLADETAEVAAAEAVARAVGSDRLVNGQLAGQACTEIYGGPDVASVTGSIGGIDVDTTFHRANGCGIADWELLQPLLGRPRWNVDQRVLQRDDPGLELVVGDRFSIELSSNETTGFAWQAMFDDAVVVAAGHSYAAPQTSLVGAGGYERFTFQAIGAGTTALKFEYRRPSQPDVAAVDSTSFEVHISPNAEFRGEIVTSGG